MIESLRTSKWIYNNAATGGIGTGLLAASGGTINFTDPDNKNQDFAYAGFGIGIFSIDIPKVKIPDIPILNRAITGTGAAKSFDGGGLLYMTQSFHGHELSKSDLQGATVYLDAGTGILAGYGASAMLLGINTTFLAPWLVNPGLGANLAANAMKQAPAVLLLYGQSEGLIASIGGLNAMLGYLR